MADFTLPASAAAQFAAHSAAKAETPDPSAAISQDFEAVFLSQFVDEMMKTAGTAAYGGDQQAEMWRSFLSEAVAERLAEQGGFGIGKNVNQMLAAYGSASKITE